MSLKRLAIILILPVLTLMLRAATYTLYVSNQTTWSTFDLYAWGDSEAFGTWPGATYAATTTLGGTTYCLYPYSVSDGAAVMEMHLIFHNNAGGSAYKNDPPEGEPQEISLWCLIIPGSFQVCFRSVPGLLGTTGCSAIR